MKLTVMARPKNTAKIELSITDGNNNIHIDCFVEEVEKIPETFVLEVFDLFK
jgi:hypothetical protein